MPGHTPVVERDNRLRGVECFAIYRLICHLNLRKWIDKQGIGNENLNHRIFTIVSNGEMSIIDQYRLAPNNCNTTFQATFGDLTQF